jgi:hypothetical protein
MKNSSKISNGVENKFDYSKICSELISDLKEREKEIISRRFGLNGLKRETLESIGQDFGISRERVRQIQKVGIEKIKSKLSPYQKVFQSFLEYFKKFGNLRKEENVLAELGGNRWKNEVYFLLTLQKPSGTKSREVKDETKSQRPQFQRLGEDDDFYSLWTTDLDSFNLAKKVIDSLTLQLQKIGRPLRFEELNPGVILGGSSLKKEVLLSFLEISKKIQKNPEGLYGLKDWPEINPRGIKDKAYLILKKVGKPLHFRQVTKLIENAHLQTVHNELIKDSRFVLVGRGIYALSEWGYYPGQVKEVILKILKESEKPLKKEEILEKVLSQRLVKENTILLNLSDRKYFLKDSLGRYRPKTEII